HPRGTLRFALGRTRSPVRVGTVSLGRLDAACLIEGPPGTSVEQWGWPIEAVLGITAFQKAGMVVLDVRHARLAVVPSSRWPR
ncbi:MAG: hypothetical protein H6R40_401, partial [Gemmatimonadetes bacterium]|nr:hypothetical protein [Gemmatimonadota bacterium]